MDPVMGIWLKAEGAVMGTDGSAAPGDAYDADGSVP